MPYLDLILLLQGTGGGNPLLGFLPLLLIIGIFYFLVFMPMQRQKRQQQQMLKELQNGDVVITTGGIVGTIVSISDDKMVLRVKPGDTRLEFLRSAVAAREESKEVKKA